MQIGTFSKIILISILLSTFPSSRESCLVLISSLEVTENFSDHPNLTWQHVNNITPRPLTKITKAPEQAVNLNFPNSIQADMDFRHCLCPYCFKNQVNTSCMG